MPSTSTNPGSGPRKKKARTADPGTEAIERFTSVLQQLQDRLTPARRPLGDVAKAAVEQHRSIAHILGVPKEPDLTVEPLPTPKKQSWALGPVAGPGPDQPAKNPAARKPSGSTRAKTQA